MAAAMGIALLTEEEYRHLQQQGEFDTTTSSWVKTPAHVRRKGGALFCDRRYDKVFVYHSGAESHYAARGIRGAPLGLVRRALVEVEAFRAVDRERLIGNLDDAATATKRKELADLLGTLDLVPADSAIIARARGPFAVNVRALDALHIATAEILAAEAGAEMLELWTHDARQATAALSRGLLVRGK